MPGSRSNTVVSHILKSTKKWKKLSNSHVGNLNIHSIVAYNYVEHSLTPPSVLHNSIYKCNTVVQKQNKTNTKQKQLQKNLCLNAAISSSAPTPSTRQLLLNTSISAALLALTVTALTGPSCSRVLCLDSSTIDHSWFDIIYIDLVGVWLVTEDTKQKEGQGLIEACHFLFGFWRYGPKHLKIQISFSMCLPESAIWLLWTHCLKYALKILIMKITIIIVGCNLQGFKKTQIRPGRYLIHYPRHVSLGKNRSHKSSTWEIFYLNLQKEVWGLEQE